MQFSTSSAAGRWQRASCLVVAVAAMLLAGSAYGSIAFTNVNPDVVSTYEPTGPHPSYWTLTPASVTVGQTAYTINHSAVHVGPYVWDVAAGISGGDVMSSVVLVPNGGYNTTVTAASRLSTGAVIDGSGQFFTEAVLYTEFQYDYPLSTWYEASSEYLGLRLNMADGAHYGWLQVSSTRNVAGMPITIEAFAYETTPNTAIVAGAIPEPASLTLLGVGALLGLRRRRA